MIKRETQTLSTGADAHTAVTRNIKVFQAELTGTIRSAAATGSPLTAEVGTQERNLGANLGSVGLFAHYENQYGQVIKGSLILRFFKGNVTIPGSRALFEQHPHQDQNSWRK